jgi:hypothetical protein
VVFVGLLVGLAFGVLSGLLFHVLVLGTTAFAFFTPIMPLVQAIAGAFAALVPSLPPILETILLFLLWFLFNFVVIGLIYFLGNSGYTMAELTSRWNAVHTMPITDANNFFAFPRFVREQFAFGFFLGAASATNFVIWLLVTTIQLTLVLALFAAAPLLAIFATLARSRVVQVLVGWTTWIMPLSWLVGAIGVVALVPFGAAGIVRHGRDAFRVDPTSGTFEVQVDFTDIPGVPPQAIGFSLGFFTFLNTATTIPRSFLDRSVSAHEAGHTLDTGAFGGIFLLVNALDENILRTPPDNYLSLGEMYAESRAPGTLRVATQPNHICPYLPLWSS